MWANQARRACRTAASHPCRQAAYNTNDYDTAFKLTVTSDPIRISRQEGVLLGRQRGRLEGKLEGKQEERQKTARRLLGLGLLTDQQIAEAQDLTIEQIRAPKAENRH